MNFKAQVFDDLEKTFQNADEFAEMSTFYLSGTPISAKIVLDTGEYINRKQSAARDHMDPQSVYQADAILYVRLKDLGRIPRKGEELELEDEIYTIDQVKNDLGELTLYLNAYTE